MKELNYRQRPVKQTVGNDVNDYPEIDIFDIAEGTATEISLPNPYTQIGTSIVHPSVVFDRLGIFGFKYWMVYTPYPNSDSQYENPCIAVSQDGVRWGQHPDVANPLISRPQTGYNSDPFIFRHPDGSKLYICYRERSGRNRIFLIESSDGIKWSPPVQLLDSLTTESNDFGSCSIYFDWGAGVWVMISHNLDLTATKPLRKHTSASDDIYSSWVLNSEVSVESSGSGRLWWHSEFRKLRDGRVIGVMMDNPSASLGAPGRLFLAESTDNMTTVQVRLISPGSLHYKSGLSIDGDGLPKIDIWKTFARDGAYRIYRDTRFGSRWKAAMASVFARYAATGVWPSELVHFDRYQRADGAVGSPEVGSALSIEAGSWQLASSRLTTTGASANRATVAMPSTDYVISGDFAARATDLHLVFRSDGTNYYRVGLNNAGLVVVQQIVSASFGTLNDTCYPDISASLPLTITVICLGKQFFLYFNDKFYKRYSDSHYFDSGLRVGVSGGGAGNAFDNLIAVAM